LKVTRRAWTWDDSRWDAPWVDSRADTSELKRAASWAADLVSNWVDHWGATRAVQTAFWRAVWMVDQSVF
jgi:hypothetical protein